MSIRKVQLSCIGLGIAQLIWGWAMLNQTHAIVGIGFFMLSIAFGLLRGER